MRKIAVMEDFLTPEHRKKVLDTAEKCGFAVDFYGRGAAPAQGLEQYEIIYGWCNPQDLKRATGLKWYCCGFAGVDQLSDDSLYASPDVVLSNSSGAYGLTISEHILMVTLMLLRRMPRASSSRKQGAIWKYRSKPAVISSCLNCWGAWGRA